MKTFSICRELYNKFNWGKNYELLVDTCHEIEMNMAQLVTFQTTRFANSIRLVVINLRADYEAVVLCLLKIQDSVGEQALIAGGKSSQECCEVYESSCCSSGELFLFSGPEDDGGGGYFLF